MTPGVNAHRHHDFLSMKALNSFGCSSPGAEVIAHELSCPFGNDSKTEQVGHGVIVPATQETEAGGSCEPNLGNIVRPCVFKALGRVPTIQEAQKCGFLHQHPTKQAQQHMLGILTLETGGA